jgi:hypothetical protein
MVASRVGLGKVYKEAFSTHVNLEGIGKSLSSAEIASFVGLTCGVIDTGLRFSCIT